MALCVAVCSGCVHSKPAAPSTASLKPQSSKPAANTQQLEIFRTGFKYGYRTKQGEVVIPATFDDACDFNGDLARVNLGARRIVAGLFGGDWGYIDRRGIIVIPIIYQFANDFSEGLAKVTLNFGDRYIDTSGNIVIRLGRHCRGGDFSEGLAAVVKSSGTGTNYTEVTDYIDKTGKVMFSVSAHGEEFHEGLAAAKVPNWHIPPEKRAGHLRGSDLYGFIKRNGDWKISPAYADAGKFSGGLAPVCVKWGAAWGTDDHWGYINSKGELVIDAQFNEARPFHRGYALVHTGGRYVMYLDAPSEWQGGKWMVIDMQGKVHKTSNEWISIKTFVEKLEQASTK